MRAACRDENLKVKQTHDLLRGTVEEFHRKFEQRIGNAAALMKVAATERERLLKAKLRAAMADGTHDEMLLALARSPIADADAIAALALWRARAERLLVLRCCAPSGDDSGIPRFGVQRAAVGSPVVALRTPDRGRFPLEDDSSAGLPRALSAIRDTRGRRVEV